MFLQKEITITIIIIASCRDENASYFNKVHLFQRLTKKKLFSFLFTVMNHDQSHNQLPGNGLEVAKQMQKSPLRQNRTGVWVHSNHPDHQHATHFPTTSLIEISDPSNDITAYFDMNDEHRFLPMSPESNFNRFKSTPDTESTPQVKTNYFFNDEKTLATDYKVRMNSQWKGIDYPKTRGAQRKNVVFSPSIKGYQGVISEVEPPQLDSERMKSWNKLYL